MHKHIVENGVGCFNMSVDFDGVCFRHEINFQSFHLKLCNYPLVKIFDEIKFRMRIIDLFGFVSKFNGKMVKSS